MEAIRSLQKLDTRRNWKILTLGLFWLIGASISLYFDVLIVQLLGVVLSGMSINGLSVLMHDACHGLLSKNKRLNRMLGILTGIPALVSFSAYRSIHLLHHSHARTELDPDDIHRTAPKSVSQILVYYVVLLAGIYIYLGTVAVVGYQKAKKDQKRKILQEYALLVGVIALAVVFAPWKAVLLVRLLPLLVAGQLANIRGLAEHGMTTPNNPFADTRTVISNGFVRFFMSNLNFHIEHHLYPGVPWYNLDRLHTIVKGEEYHAASSVYPGYTRFLADFVKATSRGYIPDASLVPAHIRDEFTH